MGRICNKCGAKENDGVPFISEAAGGQTCKPCKAKRSHEIYLQQKDKVAARSKEWKKNNPEKVYIKVRRNHLRRNFGITEADYDRMFTNQNGLCAICKNPETSDRYKKLAIDHDHETGVIRGLLCNLCNKSLGGFKDSEILLESARNYLIQNRKPTT